jgi:hypothetical protein
LHKAVEHEERIKFHADVELEQRNVSRAFGVFLDWVATILPKDKYRVFLSLFKLPTPNAQLANEIFTELKQIWDGTNPVYQYQFTSQEYKEDWLAYRRDALESPEVWKTKGWEAFRSAINSVLIVDLPKEQKSKLPEPYFYFLDIAKVHDFAMDGDGLAYIMFWEAEDKLAVVDGAQYRLLQVDGDKVKAVLHEAQHSLGYCPAEFFWRTPINRKEQAVKMSPLSAHLTNLDWLLFFMTSKKHLDLYAAYPIYSSYASDCDFENNQTGEYCDGGYLRNSGGSFMVSRDGAVHQCPICASKKIVGVGSFIEVPIPEKDGPDLRNPITVTPADDKSLSYNTSEVSRLRAEIFAGAVGAGGGMLTKESVNEMQVKANFQSKNAVLALVKDNFELAIKFVEDTCCRLRYGVNFINSSISLGTEFFNLTIEDLYAKYKQAKELGAPVAELDALLGKIIDTQYRNNPVMQQRVKLLMQLEPYRHYTVQELSGLTSTGLIDEKLLKLKINFSHYIDRFELENMDVSAFGSAISQEQKISIVNEKLQSYVNEKNVD